MRGVCLISTAVALCLVATAAPTWATAQESAAELVEAREAYEQNVALGRSLEGRPASAEETAEAERLFQEGLGKAREYASLHPRSAEAHRMAGIFLCMAYRPVSVPADPAPEEASADDSEPAMETVLRRGGAKDCEEGLAELRAALRLEKNRLDYFLDYAEALYACEDIGGCQEQALSLWDHRSSMSNSQCARCACLLADCASRQNQPDAEMRWLQEAVRYDPQHEDAGQRLADIVAAQPRIAWLSYEAGKALAANEKKPMLIDFSTSWCGWCRKMESNVFPNPEVISFCRQFVCIKVDGDQRKDLTSAYGVDGYPTTVVLDHTGRELHRIVGYRPSARYLEELRRAVPNH
jgi:thiol-disulfide isomerase/thioredoxin